MTRRVSVKTRVRQGKLKTNRSRTWLEFKWLQPHVQSVQAVLTVDTGWRWACRTCHRDGCKHVELARTEIERRDPELITGETQNERYHAA